MGVSEASRLTFKLIIVRGLVKEGESSGFQDPVEDQGIRNSSVLWQCPRSRRHRKITPAIALTGWVSTSIKEEGVSSAPHTLRLQDVVSCPSLSLCDHGATKVGNWRSVPWYYPRNCRYI